MERQNRTLLKSLKIAEAEGKKWRDGLPKFLLAHRSTPHSSTGATPAFMMFGSELRTKLPELRPNKSVLDEGIRDRDWGQKLAGKMYADRQRRAVRNPVVPGDTVLVMNTRLAEKLAPNFEPKPYTVQTKEGTEVTLKSPDGSVTSKTAHLLSLRRTRDILRNHSPSRSCSITFCCRYHSNQK